ncbi:MAG TPA: chemotaxis-specific protein-glutamate methyltransferase CheB [bacterium]
MKKKVLIVEDSILMQRVIGDIINTCDDFEVCGYARDVTEGWAKFIKTKPDIVTLDYELPGENGLVLLTKIMQSYSVPILMLSAHTKEGAELTIRSLAMGAVDFFTKPSGPISIDIYQYRDILVQKLRTVADAKVPVLGDRAAVVRIEKQSRYIVGVAASTGGVRALNYLIPSLPEKSGLRILIVQHMPKFFTATLAAHLNERASFVVKEASSGDALLPDEVLVAPGGMHLRITRDGESVQLTDEPTIHGVKPSADILFDSMAAVLGKRAIGIVLTGMGHDGAAGLKKIKDQGGITIVQDPRQAAIQSMPQAAIDQGTVDFILPLELIPKKIMELIHHE